MVPSLEERIRPDHPLRTMRRITDGTFLALSPYLTHLKGGMGLRSIPPEQVLRALLLQGLYTIRNEQLLLEAIDYSVLFRWFVGLEMDEPIWWPTTFSKNVNQVVQSGIAGSFLATVVAGARLAALLSDEHFCVDGITLEEWTRLKRLERSDGQSISARNGRPLVG